MGSSAITVGSICGILKTHSYYSKIVVRKTKPFAIILHTTSHEVIEKKFHLCDICRGAVEFYKEQFYE